MIVLSSICGSYHHSEISSFQCGEYNICSMGSANKSNNDNIGTNIRTNIGSIIITEGALYPALTGDIYHPILYIYSTTVLHPSVDGLLLQK